MDAIDVLGCGGIGVLVVAGTDGLVDVEPVALI
jgi:hypothetical protein